MQMSDQAAHRRDTSSTTRRHFKGELSFVWQCLMELSCIDRSTLGTLFISCRESGGNFLFHSNLYLYF